MGCLYRLRFPDGLDYIGVTVALDAQGRFTQHCKHAERLARQNKSTELSRGIDEFGADAVKIETLVIADDAAYLKELEKRAIAAYGTFRPNGRNSTLGGDGVSDPTGLSEQKRIASIKETKAKPEYKELQRKVQDEYWTAENRAKRAQEIRDRWKDPEYRAKMLAAPQRQEDGLHRARKARKGGHLGFKRRTKKSKAAEQFELGL